MNESARRKMSILMLSALAVISAACTRVEGAAPSSASSSSGSHGDSATDEANQSTGLKEESPLVTLLPPGPRFGVGTSESDSNGAPDAKAPASVAVVGDSLTVASQDLITKKLRAAGTSQVTVDGIEGRRMTGRSPGRPPGSEAIQDVLQSGLEPETWVIELGTNDVGAQVHPKEFRADMESIISLLPPDAAIVWVNIYVRGRAEATKQANAIIDSVAASQPNMSVANWYSLATDNPDLITSDGIHLRSAGEDAYSSMIVDAVTSAPSAPSDSSTS